jgi:hypothetical protein
MIGLFITLLGIFGLGFLVFRLHTKSTPVHDSKPYIDFLNKHLKQDVVDINKQANDAQAKAEEELKNETDKEVIDRFHDVFSKPVPGSDKPTGHTKGT